MKAHPNMRLIDYKILDIEKYSKPIGKIESKTSEFIYLGQGIATNKKEKMIIPMQLAIIAMLALSKKQL